MSKSFLKISPSVHRFVPYRGSEIARRSPSRKRVIAHPLMARVQHQFNQLGQRRHVHFFGGQTHRARLGM